MFLEGLIFYITAIVIFLLYSTPFLYVLYVHNFYMHYVCMYICDLCIHYKRQMCSYNCRIIYLSPPKWEQHFSILTDLLLHFLIQLLHSTMMIMTYESPSIHMQIMNDKVLLLLSFSQTRNIPDLLSCLNQTRRWSLSCWFDFRHRKLLYLWIWNLSSAFTVIWFSLSRTKVIVAVLNLYLADFLKSIFYFQKHCSGIWQMRNLKHFLCLHW